MGDIAHSRHDGTGKGLSCRCTAAVGLIALRKALPRLFLMVEYLDDLLSLDHLLDISIDNTNVPLLLCKEVAAALTHCHYHQQHQSQAENGHQEQNRTGNDHHEHHAYKGQSAGNQAGKAVVHDLGDGLNIVGIAAHELAVGMGIKIAQRQRLHLGKQIPPEGIAGLLRNMDHDPGVGKGKACCRNIDAGHQGQRLGQLGKVARNNGVIHQRLEKIRTADGTHAVQYQAYGDNNQQPLGAAQVFHQFFQRFAHVFGLLIAVTVSSARAAHGPGISHRYSLLPAVIGKHPGRSHWSPSAPDGSPWQRSCRRP